MWFAVFSYGGVREHGLLVMIADVLLRSLIVGIWLTAICIVLGYPTYLVFRRLRWSAWWGYVAGAGLIGGAISALILLQPPTPGQQFSYYSNAGGSCDAVIDGVRTACGWESSLRSIAMVAAFAGACGLVFWMLLRWRSSPINSA
jgi:hypothetical protein